jgi:hypothetical protein
MSYAIVTTEDARALAKLVDYFESRFPVGAEYDPNRSNWTVKHGATAVTGEPYVALTTREWSKSRDNVIRDAMQAFDDYAKGKKGKLYWRVRPEIDKQKQGWRFYMRLLISHKEAK